MSEGLRALALIFTKPLIMAGKFSDKHVFPLFLDADAVTTDAAGPLPVTTSYNIVAPDASSVSYSVADGTIAGQMMVVINKPTTVTHDAVITFTTGFNGDADQITLGNEGEQLLAMWNGSAWVLLSGEKATLSA